MLQHETVDAVIIGAGPTGCIAATHLAKAGFKVAVLEKTTFPRYRVGESLIPYCYFPLERAGLIDKVKAAGFQKKHSVQFAAMDGTCSHPFYFTEHMHHDAATTWQVERTRFDQILVDHAREAGAEIHFETQAKDLVRDAAGTVTGVQALHKSHPITFEARLTIDASGRDSFAINKNQWRVRDPKLKKVAIWTYYEDAKRDEGLDEGATTIAYLPEKGWFWYLPLGENKTSVGIVAEKAYLYRDGREPAQIFAREVQANRWIADHLAGASHNGAFRVTGDYSYRAKHIAEDGLVLAGDAFAFLDPVFSSGLFLALVGGEQAAQAGIAALRADDVRAARFGDYAERFIGGMEAFRKLVYAFYDQGFSFGALVKKYPDQRPALTDCLIGNVFRDFDQLFQAMADFAAVPEALGHGRPRTESVSC
ncbi:NAD(P)/FAD-dependent oxidoreductase [Acanthopleuribacter pedis]|uniref:Tryptophan 7-halogenase n=1 Tax=Acanthopleuribacter pedis TaxID=442870 RepID=A0A8J7QHL0_9BACT|nr:NAD(P)/FAD-dependent oxidoreductase [Acanthopleuribacter pedis]MBO1317227.1 tryptophan 7-halogenase [Acanthopleuribacter pedis]MBO1318533.1 tryptophan 7-halogenase [Acanthopleuribacter pedis]